MHSLKFAEAASVALFAPRRVSFDFRSCQESHDVYWENISRARSVLILPGYSFIAGEGNALGLPEITLANPHSALRDSSQKIEKFCEDNWHVAWSALEDMLKSTVVQAWTAFEVLVSQLHGKALMRHPECFSHLTGTELYAFMKRDLFRRSYDVAFKSPTRILNLLNDESIDALCVLRNLLTHDAGIVSPKFKEQCAEIGSAAWVALPMNKPFRFTGELVWNLVDKNVQCAYRLMDAVNEWLRDHKP